MISEEKRDMWWLLKAQLYIKHFKENSPAKAEK